jgi:hypothetical protein
VKQAIPPSTTYLGAKNAGTAPPEPAIAKSSSRTTEPMTSSLKQYGRIFYELTHDHTVIARLLLIPIVAAALRLLLFESAVGPSAYTIWLLGKEPALQKLQQAFDHANLRRFGGVDLDVKSLEIDSDDQASSVLVARKLSNATDTLLVVCDLGSTATKSAVPTYLDADPPVPLILTAQSNPDLIPNKQYNEPPPVFRLSPTDTLQAKIAANFMVNDHDKSIWLVEDRDNPVYSHYLATEFIENIGNRSKVLLWTNSGGYSVDTLKALGIDSVFYAGGWQRALVLLRELRAIFGQHMPKVVLSDASLDTHLLNDGKDDIEGTYFTFQMTAEQYYKNNNENHYGVSASVIAEMLMHLDEDKFDTIARTTGWTYWFRSHLGMHRVEDARRVLASLIRSRESGSEQAIFPLPDGENASFEVGGIREDAAFHVLVMHHDILRNAELTGETIKEK